MRRKIFLGWDVNEEKDWLCMTSEERTGISESSYRKHNLTSGKKDISSDETLSQIFLSWMEILMYYTDQFGL